MVSADHRNILLPGHLIRLYPVSCYSYPRQKDIHLPKFRILLLFPVRMTTYHQNLIPQPEHHPPNVASLNNKHENPVQTDVSLNPPDRTPTPILYLFGHHIQTVSGYLYSNHTMLCHMTQIIHLSMHQKGASLHKMISILKSLILRHSHVILLLRTLRFCVFKFDIV